MEPTEFGTVSRLCQNSVERWGRNAVEAITAPILPKIEDLSDWQDGCPFHPSLGFPRQSP